MSTSPMISQKLVNSFLPPFASPIKTFKHTSPSQRIRSIKEETLGDSPSSFQKKGNQNNFPEPSESTVQLNRRNFFLSTPIAFSSLAAANALAESNPTAQVVDVVPNVSKSGSSDSTFENLKSRVSSFSLPNGMRWIVLERHNAPIVSCHTYANVGAADEADGLTGLAHLLEHLAFKGTKFIGSRDVSGESMVLDELDEVFYALRDAKDEKNFELEKKLTQKFKELQALADSFSIPNQFGSLISRQGGVNLNAETSQDATEYYVSFPSNKLELWMALESQRFLFPVFRELYSEKEVIKEERRLRVENSPLGKFFETFSSFTFQNDSYGRPVIGYPNDFERLGRREVEYFFEQNYNPKNVVCSVVGDVDPKEVENLAFKCFGNWNAPASSSNLNLNLISNLNLKKNCNKDSNWNFLNSNLNLSSNLNLKNAFEERTLRISLPTNPFYMEAYFRPNFCSPDHSTLSVISSLLSGNRNSKFYKNLIEKGKILSAQTIESYPGNKKKCLFLLYGLPTPGNSTDQISNYFLEEVQNLKNNLVLEKDLIPIKKSIRVALLEAFGSNSRMSRLLCQYEAETGSWKNLFQEIQNFDSVDVADVLRVSNLLFQPHNRVSGHVENSTSGLRPLA